MLAFTRVVGRIDNFRMYSLHALHPMPSRPSLASLQEMARLSKMARTKSIIHLHFALCLPRHYHLYSTTYLSTWLVAAISMSTEEEDEAKERRMAEIEFVRSAYGEDEAWVDASSIIHRRLLVSSSDGNGMYVLLSLTMPDGYPIDEDAMLVIDAKVSDDAVGASSSYTAKNLRKMVMDSLPSLIEACRVCALEYVGSESIFAVLSRADEWIATAQHGVLQSRLPQQYGRC